MSGALGAEHQAGAIDGATSERSTWRVIVRRGEVILFITLAVLLLAVCCFVPAIDDRGRLAYWWSPVVFYVRTLQFPAAVLGGVWTLVLLVRRRFTLSGAVALASVLAMVPELVGHPCSPDTTAPKLATLRLMSVNQFRPNYDTTRTQQLIAAERPDVIALQEYTEVHDQQLSTALASSYPHSFRYPFPKTNGLAIYSRLPLKLEMEPTMTVGGGRMIAVSLSVAGREVVLYNIHPTSPREPSRIAENRHQVSQLLTALRAEMRPAIVIGDCNFPLNSAQMLAFRATGFRPADDFTGPGFRWTWSLTRDGIPLSRIDHAILSSSFTVERNDVGPPIGSDHRPIVVDAALHAREQ